MAQSLLLLSQDHPGIGPSFKWQPEQRERKDITSFDKPNLRYDINFDADLHFRPNIDGIKGRRKHDDAEKFWAILHKELQEFAKESGPSNRGYSGSSIRIRLKHIKQVLLTVAGKEDREMVDNVLDVDLITQQIMRGVADLGKLAEWLRYTLKQNCAPRRDETIDMACDVLKSNNNEALVSGLSFLRRVLMSMEMDLHNPFIGHPESNPFTAHPNSMPIIIAEAMKKLQRMTKPRNQIYVATDGMWTQSSPHNRRSAPNMSFSRQRLPARVSKWTIFGKVLGTLIAALPDSGADACFISPEMAVLLGLDIQPGTERSVKLASGKEVLSPGSVVVPWNFLDEEETVQMTCWVLPGCSHQMILGSKFLEETKSLTTLRRRIQRKYISVPKSVCVNLLGEGKNRLWGYLNGNWVAALPDTGSDVMVISRRYARRLGLKVESGPGNIVEVEFVDGTTALTDGIVRDVAWSSGGHSIQCDFLVLDNLSVDVILAKDYLFDMDVFSNCSANFTEDEDIEQLDIYGIRLVRVFGDRFGAMLDQLENNSIDDGM
ncbi:hypothetical protein ONZ43_g620 [Nemania bipapillata]|uniref:Uncharacterized protein n=1 Tax=Nemania bipapillata TaxID=110536 RepID=A0ACC2J7V6_9PEZI|nr:hypothetical protein ONZ43_g620 [Nemania bipapillata]